MIIRPFDVAEFEILREDLRNCFADGMCKVSDYVISVFNREYKIWSNNISTKGYFTRRRYRNVKFSDWVYGWDKAPYVAAVRNTKVRPYPHLIHNYMYDPDVIGTIPFSTDEEILIKKCYELFRDINQEKKFLDAMIMIDKALEFNPGTITLTTDDELNSYMFAVDIVKETYAVLKEIEALK